MIQNNVQNSDTNVIDEQVSKIHDLTVQRNRM